MMRGSRDGFVEALIFNTAVIKPPDSGSEADHGDVKRRRKLPHGYCGLLYGRTGG
ncbi:MAG: hypothetical protein V8S58_19130 [Lachnospiraceae bacterium]